MPKCIHIFINTIKVCLHLHLALTLFMVGLLSRPLHGWNAADALNWCAVMLLCWLYSMGSYCCCYRYIMNIRIVFKGILLLLLLLLVWLPAYLLSFIQVAGELKWFSISNEVRPAGPIALNNILLVVAVVRLGVFRCWPCISNATLFISIGNWLDNSKVFLFSLTKVHFYYCHVY